MGFFSLKATCAICGREVGLNRFKITGPQVPKGMELWKCPECAAKGGLLQIHPDGKVELLVTAKELNKSSEVKMKCNTCGHIYCYTLEDLEKNRQKAKSAALSSVAGMAGALSGHYAASGINQQNANSQLSGIVDYEQCPKCNSRDVVAVTDDELKQNAQSATANQAPLSSADELKKFKELLDSGIITQEEFDAKKKQLLGL